MAKNSVRFDKAGAVKKLAAKYGLPGAQPADQLATAVRRIATLGSREDQRLTAVFGPPTQASFK